MATDVTHSRRATTIDAVLEALRARIRRYVLAEGTARLLAAAAILVWLTLTLDWLFEPGRAVRFLVLTCTIGVLGYLTVRWIVSRATVRLTAGSMALLLERSFPEFADQLLTAVEPADDPSGSEVLQPGRYFGEMFAITKRSVVERIQSVELDRVFNPAPLLMAVLCATGLGLSVLGLALAKPVIFETWARRTMLLSGDRYPRRTHLRAPGFEHGFVKVARGANLKIVAEADTAMEVPRAVQIRYRTAGLRERAAMDREGNAQPGRDRFQKYSYTFNALSPIAFDLVGGDDRIDNLRVVVVEPPTIDVNQTTLACQFPSYLAREPRGLPVTGVVSLPRGTEVVLHGVSNKGLVGIEITTAADQTTSTRLAPSADDLRKFTLPLAQLDREQVLLLTLIDVDGIRSREPWRLVLAPIPDEAPQLTARLRGIGSAITTSARIPILGPIKDDYGLTRMWYESSLGDAAVVERDLATPIDGRTEIALEEAIEVHDLSLATGQVFHLQLKVQDNCGLAEGAHISASERFALQVVTPEELRSMLEARELNLRRRYEQLIGEVTETRDSLAGLTRPASSDSGAASGAPAADAVANGVPPAPIMPETGDMVTNRSLIVERAAQNSRKNSDETLGVATSFDDIHEELINNRVDTEELKLRLKQGIAEPLHGLAATAFPELDRRFIGLQAVLATDSPATEAALAAARQQLDSILVEMQQVLDKMVEMETFNEVVDMLRSIIDEQEKLNKQTSEQRKADARRLLNE